MKSYRPPRRLLLLLPLFFLTACTVFVPRRDLPPPIANDSFADEVKTIVIPLPVIAATPNEGILYGGLTAFLLHNAKDEVSTLLAPQVNYNENYGTTGSLYGAFYPSPGRNGEFNISVSQHVNEAYEVRLRDETLLSRKLSADIYLYRFVDGSARFFGLASNSRQQDESNYADDEFGFTITAGYRILDNLQIMAGERFRRVSIGRGAVRDLPFIREVFDSRIPGMHGFTAHAQKLGLVYSTLDSRDMPTRGYYGKLSVEANLRGLGSSADYNHYEAEGKGYFPLDDGRFITVVRAAYNQTLGGGVPFLERSILGGETTLRGYGRNRFIDSSYFLCNIEERIRLFRWEVFGVTADWEVAPFMDMGGVMERLDLGGAPSFEFNPGLGLRAVVRPNIVGRIDVGVGREGPAVFVGLGYPF